MQIWGSAADASMVVQACVSQHSHALELDEPGCCITSSVRGGSLKHRMAKEVLVHRILWVLLSQHQAVLDEHLGQVVQQLGDADHRSSAHVFHFLHKAHMI